MARSPCLLLALITLALLDPGVRVVQAIPLERYLPALSGYELEALERRSFSDEWARVGDFDAGLLQEFVLKSYSRWRVREREGVHETSAELRVYEMLDAQGAFGAFTAFRSSTGTSWAASLSDLGVDGLVDSGRVVFWRGHFFLDLSGRLGDDLKPLAAALVEAIPERNLYPFTVSQLPEKNLIRESVRFYLGERSLETNSVFPRALLTEIGLDRDVEVAAAHYEPHGNALFLIGYPTPALATEYFSRIGLALESLDRQTGIRTKKTGVMVCLFVGPREEAQRLLAEVDYAPQVQWLFERPPSPEKIRQERREVFDFLRVVMWAILFSLAGLVGLALAGLVLGTFRYRILRRNRGARRGEAMIRLNLDGLDNEE